MDMSTSSARTKIGMAWRLFEGLREWREEQYLVEYADLESAK